MSLPSIAAYTSTRMGDLEMGFKPNLSGMDSKMQEVMSKQFVKYFASIKVHYMLLATDCD